MLLYSQKIIPYGIIFIDVWILNDNIKAFSQLSIAALFDVFSVNKNFSWTALSETLKKLE